ncbi:MAG: DUF1592 domain-containing protein [Gemmataceae bacterium]
MKTPAVILIALLALPAWAADPPDAAQFYQKRCAACHGKSGEGVKEFFPRPLAGDKSVPQLAKLIAKTMPEDDPGSLSAAEAEKVAAYVYDAFYSKTAQERNRPPRVELARLTVQQYRNAVADLVESFRSKGKWDDKRGLHAEYFAARNIRNDKRVIDRTDPEVKFDFGTEAPAKEQFDSHEFTIRWEGSVLAADTGNYEFVVRSDHAVRLWLNDQNTPKPFIDAWVKSGKDTEFRASIYLIGGRAYPLRLEFSKAKQGVDDKKKNPNPPPVKAFVSLEWKPPQRAQEVIPSRNLTPNRFPETFVVSTPFPPDDRSLGWERGTAISKAWDQAATDAALETAGYVAGKLNELAGTRDNDGERAKKLRTFARTFVERAFRRPLTAEQAKLFVDRQFDSAKDAESAVKRTVILALLSPRFLYREVGGNTASGGRQPAEMFDVASRLSFGLWDSSPDQELLAAAAAGKLGTREEVVKQAERMLGDLRARAKLRDFFLTWLRVDYATDVSKDPKRFPEFDATVVSDLRTSLDLFLDEIVWSDASDFRRLLLSDELYLNGRLAKVYGTSLPADAGFQKVKLNPEQRAGVLTHPFLMAAFAHSGESSPIHRGVFLARGVLGLMMRPPPEAIAPLPPDLHPQLTTRERVMLQTKPNACMSCHAVINPLGFTLESFDAVGRVRDTDHAKKVDATGSYQTRDGKTETFAGARDLAKFLAGSEEVQAAFAEKMFHHLVQQPVRAYGPTKLDELRAAFAVNKFNMRKLAVEVLAATALTPRNTSVVSGAPQKR